MAQVSIGQVENLEDLLRGLLYIRDGLDSACREQIALTECKRDEANQETLDSGNMLDRASRSQLKSRYALSEAKAYMASCQDTLHAALDELSECENQGEDEDGRPPNCSDEKTKVEESEVAIQKAVEAVEQAQEVLELAEENRRAMEQRFEYAKQALLIAEQLHEQSRAECSAHFAAVTQSIDLATNRLIAAQRELKAYLETHPPVAQFHAWLNWNVGNQSTPVTPDALRDRINLSSNQLELLQEYLVDRNPSYKALVDKYRAEWASAKGDAERNIVARKTRIHLSGEFGEQMVRYSIGPLGSGVETQGRSFVGDNGRYTKTDLIVKDLRVPVILGRGDGMGSPRGGSMAFEVKCGKADYLYSQKDHMVFQAQGHKDTDGHCTICSRDIHDLPLEKQKELREALRESGSPLVGLLPRKNDIDQSCLVFIRKGEEEK